MLRRITRWSGKDGWLFVAGIASSSTAFIAWCSGNDGTNSTTTDSSSSSGSGGEGVGGVSSSSGSAGAGGGSSASCTNDPSTAANTQAVVDAVNALIATLSATEKTAIQYDLTLANAQNGPIFRQRSSKETGSELRI